MGFKLIAYAMDFSSFLVQKVKEKYKIKNIILFGSVSREEAGKTSDVDIFFERKEPQSFYNFILAFQKFVLTCFVK